MTRVKHQPQIFGMDTSLSSGKNKPNGATKGESNKATNESVNDVIISATKAINDSAATSSSSRVTYMVSAAALVVIAALAFQNHTLANDRQQLNDILTSRFAQDSSNMRIDSGPTNQVCLQVLSPDPVGSLTDIFGKQVGHLTRLLEQTDDQVVSFLSETVSELPVHLATGEKHNLQDVSRLYALIAAGCNRTFDAIKKYLPLFDTETLFEARQAAEERLNFDQYNEITNILADNKKLSASDLQFLDTLVATDPKSASDVKTKLLEDLARVLTQADLTHADFGLQTAQAGFQARLVQTPLYKDYLTAEVQSYLENGKQDALRTLFESDTIIGPEKKVIEQVKADLDLQKNDEGNWVISSGDNKQIDNP